MSDTLNGNQVIESVYKALAVPLIEFPPTPLLYDQSQKDDAIVRYAADHDSAVILRGISDLWIISLGTITNTPLKANARSILIAVPARNGDYTPDQIRALLIRAKKHPWRMSLLVGTSPGSINLMRESIYFDSLKSILKSMDEYITLNLNEYLGFIYLMATSYPHVTRYSPEFVQLLSESLKYSFANAHPFGELEECPDCGANLNFVDGGKNCTNQVDCGYASYVMA